MEEFYDEYEYEKIEEYCEFLNNHYSRFVYGQNVSLKRPQPFPNYLRIITHHQRKYILPEIIEKHILSGDESIAIIKTVWIKIIQRTWKKIFSLQQEVKRKRQQYSSIRYRELHGTWPVDCAYYPTLRGMLSSR